jgi:hypothetical protein
VAVSNYLLLVSVVNIISLILLFVKIIHILLGSAGLLMNHQINLICCKLFSSLLSITVRINYWLISLIIIERFYANPQQINSSAILCVTNFEHRMVSTYNYINVLIYHLVPFVIQVISIILLIVWAAKGRARTTSSRTRGFSQILRKQFQTQKELYITLSVIILAALPQLIFTSSFVCTELNYAWQCYDLLIAYLFSFIPLTM